MRDLFVISNFVLIVGFFISERFLAQITGLTLGTYFFSLPLIGVFLLFPKKPQVRFLTYGLILYIFILTLIWVKGGLANFDYYYGICGATFIGWIMAGKNFNERKIHIILKFFAILSMLIASSYFFGAWDTSRARAKFLGQNINFMGHLMCLGFAVYWYMINYFKIHNKSNLFFSLGLLLFIPTIVATVSRTSIFCLVVMILIFLFIQFGKKYILILGLAAGLIYVNINFFSNLTAVKRIENRNNASVEDPRVTLALSAMAFIKQNPYTGGGLKMFSNLDAYSKANIGAIDHNGKFKALSIHNSFLDLAIIGGIFFPLIYIVILLYLFVVGLQLMFSKDSRLKNIGAFAVSNFVIIFAFSFTGQAFYLKQTWWAIGICFLLFSFAHKIKVSQSKKMSLA